jgi:hypothetical protein
MRLIAVSCVLATLLLAGPVLLGVDGTVVADGVAVRIEGASRPTRCQEEDNVYVKLIGDAIARFRIVAEPPAYSAEITTDRSAPDFTDCDMRADPRFEFTPKTLTLFENAELRLVGHTFASFWRPDVVMVRVGGADVPGLHLLQLFAKAGGSAEEFLVLYPADGYWRAKPLPPAQLPGSAYGSSFLVGPITEVGRPLVAISAVSFDPAALAFALDFADGSRGRLAVTEVSRARIALDVAFDPPLAGERVFAALRSMFVRADAADVETMWWRDRGDAPWQDTAVIALDRVSAAAVRFGRTKVSLHNTSAPDLMFLDFVQASAAP